MIKVKADIMWADMNTVNDYTGKYQLDLCNLSDPAVAALEEMGITPGQKEGKGYFICCKSTRPISGFYKSGEFIDPSIRVGNGSKGVALIGAYDWNFKGKEGTSPSLKKLVINELVPYDNDPEVVGAIMDDDEVL